MTIASEIQRIQGNISDAYNACAAKGATMPVTNNSASLANTINTIQSGGGGFDEVGRYMVSNGVAELQGGDVSNRFLNITSIQANVFQNEYANCPMQGTVNFANLVSVGNYSLDHAFYNCNLLNGVSLPQLSTITGNQAFNHTFFNCTNVIDVNFANLSDSGNGLFHNTFYNATKLATADFSNLQTLSGFYGTFRNCKSLTAMDFPSLVNASNYGTAYAMGFCFADCANLTTVTFPNLSNVTGNSAFISIFLNSGVTDVAFSSLQDIPTYCFSCAFYNCSNINTVDFSALKNVANYGFVSCFGASHVNKVDFSGIEYINNASAFNRCFDSCYINSVDFSNLQGINAFSAMAACFSYAKNITTFEMPNLTYSNGQQCLSGLFYNCKSIERVYLNNLSQIGIQGMQTAFMNCTNLLEVNISNVSNIAFTQVFNNAFAQCSSLTSLYFNSLTTSSFGTSSDQFNNMLRQVNGCTVHFPASIQSTIGSWASVVGGFGGTNTTVLFDL